MSKQNKQLEGSIKEKEIRKKQDSKKRKRERKNKTARKERKKERKKAGPTAERLERHSDIQIVVRDPGSNPDEGRIIYLSLLNKPFIVTCNYNMYISNCDITN